MSIDSLAIILRDLRRNDDSLERAEEATGLYRELARARPEAFTPDLARSLNTLSNILLTIGRREDAIARAEDAVRALAPFFLSQPVAFEELMGTVATTYCKACKADQREYDLELLGPIVAMLQTVAPGRWRWP
jgi:hypothetical protein